MIDGLRLTMSGDEMRRLIEERLGDHRRSALRWTLERTRAEGDGTADHPVLPDHLCENEAERHEWRIEVLEFIRDHVEAAETYRIGEADLAFAELLPPKPGWIDQEEFDERTRVGFTLERLTNEVRGLSRAVRGGSASTPARGEPDVGYPVGGETNRG